VLTIQKVPGDPVLVSGPDAAFRNTAGTGFQKSKLWEAGSP